MWFKLSLAPLYVTLLLDFTVEFYSAVFFDNGCTIQQHFVVEFHNFFQILIIAL